MKYCPNTLEYKIWLTNTKPFFWESQGKLETLEKLSLYVRVAYKFVLKCLKSQIEPSGPCNIVSRLENAKFVRQLENYFLGKARQSFKFSKNVLSMLECPINCSEVCQRLESFE